MVKRDIRLSVVLDGGGGWPLSATDLPYLDLAANDVTEVICTLDDTAPDDGLRGGGRRRADCALRAPLALTRGARLNRAVARMRGDFVYFADPSAPPVAGGLACLVAEGDRATATSSSPGPRRAGALLPENSTTIIFYPKPAVVVNRSNWCGQAIFRWRLARNCRFLETLDGTSTAIS